MPLADYLMRRHARPGTPIPPITPVLRQAMLMHDWPGNVRELENAMRRLLVLGNPDELARELQSKATRKTLAATPVLNLPGTAEPVAVSAPILEQVTRAKHQAETEAILAALSSTRWNRKKAAALLKIDYKALLYKMKKLQIEDRMVTLPPEAAQASGGKRMLARAAGD